MAELEAKQMLQNALILYSSDNGGVEQGINYPLRGEKHSSWEGAMRVASLSHRSARANAVPPRSPASDNTSIERGEICGRV